MVEPARSGYDRKPSDTGSEMRVRLLSIMPLLLAVTGLGPAAADPLEPDAARRFVAGKLFSYQCFEGTQGMGRIFSDGSVVGTMQPPGRAPRFVALPAGTVQVSSTSICASVRGLLFRPCFVVDQTSSRSFRGSLSGLGFAYCDFVRRNPRSRVTRSGDERERGGEHRDAKQPLGLRPTKVEATGERPPLRSAVMRTED